MSVNCEATFAAFKQYVSPIIVDNYQAYHYNEFRDKIANWQQCCPGAERTLWELFPNKRIEFGYSFYIGSIELPSIFSHGTPCSSMFHDHKSVGDKWMGEFVRSQSYYWSDFYEDITTELHRCCVRRFEQCLAAVERNDDTGQLTASEVMRCQKRFAPDKQLVDQAGPPTNGDILGGIKIISAHDSQAVLARLIELNKSKLPPYDLPPVVVSDIPPSEAPSKPEFELNLDGPIIATVEDTNSSFLQEQLLASKKQINNDSTAVFLLCVPLALAGGFLLGIPGRTRFRAVVRAGAVGSVLAGALYWVMSSFIHGLLHPSWIYFPVMGLLAALLLVALRTLVRFLVLTRLHGPLPLATLLEKQDRGAAPENAADRTAAVRGETDRT